jgi:hypothetical protein
MYGKMGEGRGESRKEKVDKSTKKRREGKDSKKNFPISNN